MKQRYTITTIYSSRPSKLFFFWVSKNHSSFFCETWTKNKHTYTYTQRQLLSFFIHRKRVQTLWNNNAQKVYIGSLMIDADVLSDFIKYSSHFYIFIYIIFWNLTCNKGGWWLYYFFNLIVLKADFIRWNKSFFISSGTYICASFVGIIRVITMIHYCIILKI